MGDYDPYDFLNQIWQGGDGNGQMTLAQPAAAPGALPSWMPQ